MELLEARQMLALDSSPNLITVTTDLDDWNAANDATTVSLREALALAAGDGSITDGDTIQFAPSVAAAGLIQLTHNQNGDAFSDELFVNSNVIIDGPGATALKIDARGQSRVFQVAQQVTATIRGLTIAGGGNVPHGGGVLNQGDLRLERVVVEKNQSTNTGGGISSFNGASGTASLRLTDSTVDSNRSQYGGGLKVDDANGGVLEIKASTISNNVALNEQNSGLGGGLWVQVLAGADASIVNSTFSANASLAGGAVIVYGAGELLGVNNTIAYNHADVTGGFGGGVVNLQGAVITLHNTILAKNTDASTVHPDVYGSVGGTTANPSSHNILGVQHSSVATSAFAHSDLEHDDNGNQVGSQLGSPPGPLDPMLAPLGDNGGETKTHALFPNSPAIDAGNASQAAAAGLTNDQRGPGFKRQVIGGVDIGAVEAYVAQSTPTAAIVVHGTDSADGITIGSNVSGQTVVAIDSTGGVEMPVNLSSAASVTVYSNGGDDAVSVQSDQSKPVTVFGGAGEDLLRGGAGNDKLVGGLGADVLVGGDGDDNLYGAHDTSVLLTDGADTFFGDAGADVLHVDYLSLGIAYTVAGGDVFQADGDTVVADSGGYAPTPTGSAWQQNLLWNGNYGFGTGWNVVGIDRLQFSGPAAAPTSLQWVRADGHIVTMTRQSTSHPWTAVSGDPSVSEINYNATTQKFTRADKYGNVSEYLVSATGLAMVVKAVDRLGVGREYSYGDHDGDGASVELESITIVRAGQVDEVTSYNYSTVTGGHRRITSIVDPFGRTTTIEYLNGKVARIKLPSVTVPSSQLNANQRFHESGRPEIAFLYDGNGFISKVVDPDYVSRDYTWQFSGELWVADADPNLDPTPIRYRGAPSNVYTQWMEKTEAWREFLPAQLLTDGLAGMGATDVKQGYTIDEAGRTTTLHYNRDGGVVWKRDPKGAITEIVRTTAGLPDQVTVKAPGDQRVVDQMSYEYDASHNVIEATYFDGTQASWDYDPTFSQLTLATDELGRQTAYDVDPVTGNTKESRVIVGLDDGPSSETNDVVTQFEYTADGLISQIIEFRNDIDGTAQMSFVTQYSYTNTNSATGTAHNSRRWQAVTYGGDNPSIADISFINSSTVSVAARDDYDNPAELIDELGRSTFYDYDELDRLIFESTDDPGFGQLVAAIEYDYSLGGRLGARSFGTLVAPGGALAFTASASSPITDEYYYDECDCPTGTSLDCWNFDFAMHSRDEYNPYGTLGSSTGPDGRTTSNDYGPSSAFSAVGNLGPSSSSSYSSSSSSFSSASTLGPSSSSSSSSPSPVRQQLGPQGSGFASAAAKAGSAALVGSTPGNVDILYLYNARNELVAVRDGAGVLTRYEYDGRGRLVHTVTGEGSGSESRYDAAGQLVATVDGEGRATHYQYDDAGRLVAERAPAHEAPTTFQYDSAGNLRKIIDPLGHVQELVYDERGRVIESIDENEDSTYFTHYADNQQHTLTDAADNTTTWTYDGVGRVHTETNELGHTETYYYDEFHRLAEVEDKSGRIVQYEYDGRTLKLERWIESGATVREFSYFYRESPQFNGGTSGQVSLIVDTGDDHVSAADDLRHSYRYDDQGRLEFSEMHIGGLDAVVETVRGYDLGDRVIGTQFSLDAWPGYLDGSRDGALDHENAFVYDSAGRMAVLTQTGPFANPKRVDVAYNRADQFAGIERYAAVTPTNPVASTQYQYDEHGQLIRIDHAGMAAGSTFAEAHVYGYDGAGRLASYINSLGLPYAADYVYDDRGQLIGETGYGSTTYQYDDNGNRTFAENPWLQEYSHFTIGANNRLMEEWGYENEPTPDYTYDNEGNRTSRFIDLDDSDQWDANETGVQYTWDHRNRLTKVTERTGPSGAATRTIDYSYDVFNQLVKRVEDPDSATGSAAVDQTFYVFEQGQVALEFHQTGSGNLDANDLSHRYLWGPVVDQLFADEQVNWSDGDADGETLWALGDHLGSVRDVVDSNGDLRIHRAFDAFGHVEDEAHYNAAGQLVTAGQAGYVDTAFAFTGKLFDVATGLQNNLNRWYDPKTGHWMSEDPIGFAAGDANLYRYVGNMPTMYIDPNGLAEEQLPWWEDSWRDWIYPWSWGASWGDAIGDRATRVTFDSPHDEAEDSCKTLQAGDIGTWNGNGSQLDGAAEAEREIIDFGRGVRRDFLIEVGIGGVGGIIIGKLDDAARYRNVIERHHNLPRKYADRFGKAGLNFEDFTEPMRRCDHRLKPDGLHTGPNNWNTMWDRFFNQNPNPSRQQILDQLNDMRRRRGMPPWQVK